MSRSLQSTIGIGLLLWLSVLACAGNTVRRDELPPEPIAVLFWDREEARRRAEVIERSSGAGEFIEEGIATPGSMAAIFGDSKEEKDLGAQLRQWPGRLALIDPRSAQVEILESTPPGARPLGWDPEHRRILFASERVTGTSQLFLYDTKTQIVRPLTHGEDWHTYGAFAHDGSLVFTEIARDGQRLVGRVYRARSDGSGRERLLDDAFHPEVQLDPNGDSLILVTNEGEERKGSLTRQRYVMVRKSLGEDGAQQILGRGHQPIFSRDGKWLVYVFDSRDGPRIVRSRSDGAGRRPLSGGNRDHQSPAISPDSAYVASVGSEGEFNFLFIRRIDGSGERILLDSGSVAWPVW